MPRDLLTFDGFSIGIDLDQWPAKILRALLRRHYEKNERHLVSRVLHAQDRIIELGSAIGVVALAAARVVKPENIFCYDANPAMVVQAEANFSLNNTAIAVSNKLLVADARFEEGAAASFFTTPYFLSSSLLPHRADMTAVEVETASLEKSIAAHGANVMIMDIEGGEYGLLTSANLHGIEKLVLELHIEHGSVAQALELIAALGAQGLALDMRLTSENVFVFHRTGETAVEDGFASAYLEALEHTGKNALEAIEAALRHEPDNAYAHAHKAALFAKQGDFAGALAAAQAACRIDGHNPDTLELIGILNTRLGDNENAAAAYAGAGMTDKYRPLFHAALGTVLMRLGDDARALKAFRSACALLPPRACTFEALLALSARQDKFDETRQEYVAPALDDKGRCELLHALGERIAGKFKLPDAGSALTQALRLAPEENAMHAGLAMLLATPGDLRKVLNH